MTDGKQHNESEVKFRENIYEVVSHRSRNVRGWWNEPEDKKNGYLIKVNKNLAYNFQDLNLKIEMELENILKLLQKKEALLTLEDNWNDDGAVKISTEAWKSTAIFLVNYSNQILSEYKIKIEDPRIYPASDGSIDLLWETQSYALAVKIDNTGTIAHFYTDEKDFKNKGFFNPKNFNIHKVPKAFEN